MDSVKRQVLPRPFLLSHVSIFMCLHVSIYPSSTAREVFQMPPAPRFILESLPPPIVPQCGSTSVKYSHTLMKMAAHCPTCSLCIAKLGCSTTTAPRPYFFTIFSPFFPSASLVKLRSKALLLQFRFPFSYRKCMFPMFVGLSLSYSLSSSITQ